MSEVQEQLRPFLDAIREAAEKSCRLVQQETDRYIRAEMAKTEQEAHDQYEIQYQKSIQAVRRQADAELAAYQAAARSRLSQLRQAYEQAVFADARQALTAFTATAAYGALLEDSARAMARLLEAYPQADAVLCLRSADADFAERVRAAFGRPCRVDTDDAITLGGLKLHSEAARLTLDDTLETRLEQQRPRFRQSARLSVL